MRARRRVPLRRGRGGPSGGLPLLVSAEPKEQSGYGLQAPV